MVANSDSILSSIKHHAHILNGHTEDYAALSEHFKNAKIVLLGEATHGTYEFYKERINITKQLITRYGFNAVAIEGDWPDAYRVNQYVKGYLPNITAKQSLDGFKRFPTWMWCNLEVLGFIEWLHHHNAQLSDKDQVGFYGLDLYSLHASMTAVISYLDKVDPAEAKHARERYACFDHFGINPQTYAYAAHFGGADACDKNVTQQLYEIKAKAAEYLMRNGRSAADDYFTAEQNAKLVKNVEQYYRLMFDRNVSSWNLRDRHMADTLEALDQHLTNLNDTSKIVVWAHNSHIGDARATEMGYSGDFNIGQLVRERYGKLALNIGFTTYTGTVTASSNWDEPGQRQYIRPAIPESYESLFHETGLSAFLLIFDKHNLMNHNLTKRLHTPLLERAIGVIYRPETERESHYFTASLSDQFNAVIHFDETHALEPLDSSEHWLNDEKPETYPFGF